MKTKSDMALRRNKVRSSPYQEPSSHEVPRFFHEAAMYCRSVRVVERGGCRRRKAELGDVIRLTVSYGCAVSNDGSNRLVTPYSTQGTTVTLWSPGVKPAAPMKTDTTSEFVGRQINDIVNCFVSPSASGTPHESQFDRRTTGSVKSNTFTYGVELTFEVELELNFTCQSPVEFALPERHRCQEKGEPPPQCRHCHTRLKERSRPVTVTQLFIKQDD